MSLTLAALHRKAERMNMLPIESECGSMTYYVDPRDCGHIGIGTSRGAIVLTREQIKSIAGEAIEILDMHADGRALNFAHEEQSTRNKPVVKLDMHGRVLGCYPSMKEAAKDGKSSYAAIGKRCRGEISGPDQYGHYYRFK